MWAGGAAGSFWHRRFRGGLAPDRAADSVGGGRMRQRQGNRRGLAIGVVLIGGIALSAQALGQDLRFGFDQRFEASDNQALRAPSQGSSLTSTSRLSFGYTSETPAATFQFGGSGVLRGVSGAVKGQGGFQDPSLRMSYTRTAASGEFGLSARLTSNEIAFLRPFEDFLDPETGEFVPPEDLEDLTGSGRRTSYGADARLRLGDQARVGTTLRAGIRGTRYQGVTNPALVDSRRVSAGLGLRFSLSNVTEAVLDMGWSRFSNQSALQPDRDTLSLSLGLSHDRPDGRLTARLSAEKRDASRTRYGISLGRSHDLLRGGLSYGLGVTWGDAAGRRLNGNIAWTHELPDGQIRLAVNHGLATGSNDSTRQVTSATFGWQHRVTELSALSLDMGLHDSRNLTTGTSVRNISLGLGYSHQITEDWALNTGYRHRQRDSSGTQARSNTVFLSVRRDFATRF